MFGGTRFKYDGTDSVGVRKKRYDGERYAKRINGTSQEDSERIAALRQRLRTDMKNVGDRVARTLHEDGYESFYRATKIRDLNRELDSEQEIDAVVNEKTDEYVDDLSDDVRPSEMSYIYPREEKSWIQKFWGWIING
jgi:hypothetical protein